MCFSANASFAAGIAISAIGVVTIRKVQAPSQIVFASIPLIFGIQQLAEGVLWLSIPDPTQALAQEVATYTFLFFARVVWPLWVPLAIFLLENEGKRRKMEKVLLLMGIGVSAYFTLTLLLEPTEAVISEHHIFYKQDYPASLKLYSGLFYGVVTVLPLFVSRFKRMWLLGIIIGVSYIVAIFFFKHYAFSVWCFFAAIISMSVYFIMNEVRASYAGGATRNAFIHYDGGFKP